MVASLRILALLGIPRLSKAAARSRRSSIMKRGEATLEESTSTKLSLIQSRLGSRALFSKGRTTPTSNWANRVVLQKRAANTATDRDFILASNRNSTLIHYIKISKNCGGG